MVAAYTRLALIAAIAVLFTSCDASGGSPSVDTQASSVEQQTSTTLRSSAPALEEIDAAIDLESALIGPSDVGFGDSSTAPWRAYQPTGECAGLVPPSSMPTLESAGRSVTDSSTGDDLVVSQVARFETSAEAERFIAETRQWIEKCPEELRPIDERSTLQLLSSTSDIPDLGDSSVGVSIAVTLFIDGVDGGSGAVNAAVYASQGNLAVVIRIATVEGSVEQAASLARLVLSRLATS